MSDTYVSIDEIEQIFLVNEKMYLSAQLNDMLHLEISHSEIESAKKKGCDLFLTIGENSFDGESLDFFFSAHSTGGESYTTCTLDDVIRIFRIDRTKAMWEVSCY